MSRAEQRAGWLGAVGAFVAAATLSAGCAGLCKDYCDGFEPEIAAGVYDVEIYEETASDAYAIALTAVEIGDEQVVLTYDDLDGVPQAVVWDITRVESP